MAEEVEFGKVPVEYTKSKKGMVLYPPQENKSVTVRFVGSQQKIYQRWDDNVRSFSCYEQKIEGTVQRIISFVVDRADEQVKAFICPVTAFRQMAEFNSSHDFKITREGSGKKAKYIVESLGESSVSEELKNRVEITSKTYPLVDIFIKLKKWELLESEPESESIEDRFDILDL